MAETAPSITCPRCDRTSYNPNDIVEGYCGFCHWWTSDPRLGAPDVISQAERDGAINALPPPPEIEILHGQPYWSGKALDSVVEGAFIIGLVAGLLIGAITLWLYANGY